MHSSSLALLMTLGIIGCTPSVKGPADTASLQGGSVDTAQVDSVRTGATVPPAPVEWHVLRTDPSILVFGTGDTLRMHAKDLHLLSQLASPLGKPWLVFSGVDAGSRDEQRNIYVVSPGDSLARGSRHSWHMPGRLIDSTSEAPYYEASVFSGEVLHDTIGVVWYDRSLMPDGQWRLNTTILRLDLPGPDTIVLFGQGRKSATIDLAVKGKCISLLPLDQRTASH